MSVLFPFYGSLKSVVRAWPLPHADGLPALEQSQCPQTVRSPLLTLSRCRQEGSQGGASQAPRQDQLLPFSGHGSHLCEGLSQQHGLLQISLCGYSPDLCVFKHTEYAWVILTGITKILSNSVSVFQFSGPQSWLGAGSLRCFAVEPDAVAVEARLPSGLVGHRILPW